MPRKKTKDLVRHIEPDRLYNSVQVQRLINRVMLNGKKQMAERLVYNGMQQAANKLKIDNPLDVFEQAYKTSNRIWKRDHEESAAQTTRFLLKSKDNVRPT